MLNHSFIVVVFFVQTEILNPTGHSPCGSVPLSGCTVEQRVRWWGEGSEGTERETGVSSALHHMRAPSEKEAVLVSAMAT